MIAAGIAVALVAAAANAAAVLLLRLEARRAPEREAMHASLLLDLAHRPRWLAGIALTVLAAVLQVTALALAPIAVVQPTLATGQLMLVAIARLRRPDVVGARELAGSVLIAGGIGCVVATAPVRVAVSAPADGLAPPLAVVGGLAMAAFAFGRWHPRVRGMLAIGAGLAYAWADFAAKLLSDAASKGRWTLVGVWVGAILLMGTLAFLEENTALQRRLAVTVAPVISAIKIPLPVLMALWSGVEPWRGGALGLVLLPLGLLLAAAGSYLLGSSDAVTALAGSNSRRPGRRGARG